MSIIKSKKLNSKNDLVGRRGTQGDSRIVMDHTQLAGGNPADQLAQMAYGLSHCPEDERTAHDLAKALEGRSFFVGTRY